MVENPLFGDVGQPQYVPRDLGFGSGGTVTIDGVPLNVTSWSADTITGTVGAGTTTGSSW